MSLDNPSRVEKAIKAWEGFGYKRYVVYGLLALFLIGVVLYLFEAGGNWNNSRKIDKLKANVNAAVDKLAESQANVAKAKQDEAVQLDRVKKDTEALVVATNATDAAKQETNRALDNLNSAVNANRSVDVTGDNLKRQIKELNE